MEKPQGYLRIFDEVWTLPGTGTAYNYLCRLGPVSAWASPQAIASTNAASTNAASTNALGVFILFCFYCRFMLLYRRSALGCSQCNIRNPHPRGVGIAPHL